MFSIGGWELTNFLSEAVTDLSAKIFVTNITNSVVAPIYLFSLLFFALAFARKKRWIKWAFGLGIINLVGLSVLLAFSPEFLYQSQGLVTRGPVTILGFAFEEWVLLDRSLNTPFLLYQLYAYTVTLVAAGIVIQHISASREDIYSEQAVLVGIGFGTPLLLNGLVFLGVIPPKLNPTDLGFGVTAISFAVAIFRYQLFTAIPVGRQELVDVLDDPIVLVDNENRVVDSNQTARQLFDIEGNWQGRDAIEFFEPHAEFIQPSLTADGGAHKLTIDKNGRTRFFDVNTTPVRTPSGDTGGQLISLRDVSALEQTKQELEQSNERLNQFASVVSHDLRNPLNAAQLRIDLVDSAESQEHIESAQQSLERMETMIDDLLTLARAGETVEDPEEVLLADVALESWDTATTGNANFDLEISETTIVTADRDRLQHVFENLFRNAVDHNELPLTIRVGTFGIRDETGEGTTTGFFIEDDGDGIPDDEQDEIFEYGYTTSNAGTGFGLSIVSDVVEGHGWEISVTESDDGGARFEIRDVEVTTD
jgi:PAS domain S-box-containing protein